jgi:hypothetical protein
VLEAAPYAIGNWSRFVVTVSFDCRFVGDGHRTEEATQCREWTKR